MLRKFKFHQNLTRITGTLREDQYIFLIIYHSVLLRMRNVSGETLEKIKTHILCSVTIFRKSRRLWNIVEKYSRAGDATDENMGRALCTLDILGYKHILKVCNTCFFPTATMVARTRPIVTLYVHWLSCIFCRKYGGEELNEMTHWRVFYIIGSLYRNKNTYITFKILRIKLKEVVVQDV
jgi:hypothetical protein